MPSRGQSGPASTRRREAGVTLIDTVVGVSLLLVIFLGVFGAFRLTLDVVENNKARAGAIALADERMEYIRSLPYTSIGTSGGIPSGSLAQSESVTFNGIAYTRRTLVEYADDSKDGTGVADTTGIADYKTVKIELSWRSHSGSRSISVVSRFEPTTGLESAVTGGTLTINVVNASSQAVSNAQVSIVNTASSPTVNLTTYTNTNGTVSLIGAPVASNYQITVTKGGYSTAQTYSATAQNPNPSPAHLTVSSNQTTSSTFAIDQTSSLDIATYLYGSTSTITNVPVTIRSAKTIGSNPTNYKYTASVGGTGNATTTLSSLEWDTYTMSVSTASGYDLASSCSPQPVSISPGSAATTILYLAPHTVSSIPIKVTAASSGSLISGASVRLYKIGYDQTQATDGCGQTFFSNLSTGTYSLSVSASGYTTYNTSSLTVGTTTTVFPVSLN